jgi:hypothetical protein
VETITTSFFALMSSIPKSLVAVGLRPGLLRRSPSLYGSTSQIDFQQVFARQVGAGAGIDRTIVGATVKNAKTQLYPVDGTSNNAGLTSPTAGVGAVRSFEGDELRCRVRAVYRTTRGVTKNSRADQQPS